MLEKNNEWNFLIKICENFVHKNIDLNSFYFTLKTDFNWNTFYSYTKHHRIITIVYNELYKLKEIEVPSSIWNEMSVYNKIIISNNLSLTNESIKLTNILNDKGLDLLHYKGITLSHFVYQNIGDRPTADIDIMVDIDHVGSIINTLEKNNYQFLNKLSDQLFKIHLKRNCEVSIRKKTADEFVFIDMHWRISNNMLQMNTGFNEMKNESKLVDFFGTKINYLNPEALFITLAMHHYGKEKMVHLKQIIDLGMVIERYKNELDWNKLISLSKEWKVLKLTLYSLKICQKLLNLNVPEHIALLIKKNCDEKFITTYLNTLQNSKGKYVDDVKDDFVRGIKLHLKVRDNFLTKLKVIYYHLLTIILPNEMDFKNPKTATTLQWHLAFFKKPFRLFKNYIIS